MVEQWMYEEERTNVKDEDIDIDGLTEKQLLTDIARKQEDIDEIKQQELMRLVSELTPSQQIMVTNHPPERAVREASLASKKRWKSRQSGMYYVASNELVVSLGTPEVPLDLEEAREEIKKLGVHTTLTDRILFWYWNIRRRGPLRQENGSVPVLLIEVLRMLGVDKHKKLAYPGTQNDKTYTDGYRAEHKERIIRNVAILSAFQVEGPVLKAGFSNTIEVQGPYLRSSIIRRKFAGQKTIVGFFVSPGDWVNSLDLSDDSQLTRIDEAIFQLDPQNDQHAIRLSLYLAERWRDHAHHRAFDEPIKMIDLLAASMIEIDYNNLTSRFAERIDRAFETLESKGIIGGIQYLTPLDCNQPNLGRAWLSRSLRILPPEKFTQTLLAPAELHALPESKQRRKSKRTSPNTSIPPTGSGEY